MNRTNHRHKDSSGSSESSLGQSSTPAISCLHSVQSSITEPHRILESPCRTAFTVDNHVQHGQVIPDNSSQLRLNSYHVIPCCHRLVVVCVVVFWTSFSSAILGNHSQANFPVKLAPSTYHLGSAGTPAALQSAR
jgi:hypothetical protein